MNLIQVVIAAFTGLSALVWLAALGVNASACFRRVILKKTNTPETVGLVGLIAAAWVFFAARSLWPQVDWVWWLPIFLPPVLAVAANAADYRTLDSRKNGLRDAGRSDPPEGESGSAGESGGSGSDKPDRGLG